MPYDPQRSVFWFTDMWIKFKILGYALRWILTALFFTWLVWGMLHQASLDPNRFCLEGTSDYDWKQCKYMRDREAHMAKQEREVQEGNAIQQKMNAQEEQEWKRHYGSEEPDQPIPEAPHAQ